MSGVKIRKALPSDITAACDIAKECWADIYAGYREQLGDEIYGTVYAVDPLAIKAERIKRAIEDGRVFVAECDGTVCGFSSFMIDGKLGHLNENGVSSDFRGRKIAAKLYDAVFERLREDGCEVVSVGTGLDDAHAPARRAYEKAGFEASLSSITYYKKL